MNVESKFGGVPVEEKPTSKFGGIPVEQEKVVPVQGASIDINTINQTALNNVVTADTEDPEAKQVFEENEKERQMMLELSYRRLPSGGR